MRSSAACCLIALALLSCYSPDEDPSLRQAEFYDTQVVQDVEFEITTADLQALQDALPTRIYVPATLTWNDVTVANVGVRYKGNSSSDPVSPYKRSFLIKFSQYVRGQRFLGMRRVSFDNGIQFGSLFSERLVTDMLADIGLVVYRTNYVRLKINGTYMGVYVNVERIDKSFLERNFGGTLGNLYKADEGGPGSDLRYLGTDALLYQQAFELKTNKLVADYTDLRDLTDTLATASPLEFEDWFFNGFEGDAFLKTLPVMLFAGAFDQYTGFNAHNYYLYFDTVRQRWNYLPWDLDVGFADNAFDVVPVLAGWNASYPIPDGQSRPLLEQLLSNPMLLATYRSYAADYLETYFEPTLLKAKLDALYAQIRPDLATDPFPHTRITNRTDVDYDSVVASLKTFIDARYAQALTELANPIDMRPSTGPQPGSASPSDPSNLVVVTASAVSITVRWTDNATDEGAFIVQRCTGAACTDFTNHIGIPVADTIQATDSTVAAGTTYQYRVYAVRPGIGFTGASNAISATAI